MDIYVSNLPILITSQQLENLFKVYGAVSQVRLFQDKHFAIVKMETDPEAQKAIQGLNDKNIGGKNLRVKLAQGIQPKRYTKRTFISKEWRDKAEFKD